MVKVENNDSHDDGYRAHDHHAGKVDTFEHKTYEVNTISLAE